MQTASANARKVGLTAGFMVSVTGTAPESEASASVPGGDESLSAGSISMSACQSALPGGAACGQPANTGYKLKLSTSLTGYRTPRLSLRRGMR